MKNEKLLKLLDDMHIVNAGLNSMSADNSKDAIECRVVLLREKFRIQAQLNLYTEDEINAVTAKKSDTPKDVYVEEVEVKKVEERGVLYYMLLMYILNCDSKNKAFLLIALELFCKDEKIIKKYRKVKV